MVQENASSSEESASASEELSSQAESLMEIVKDLDRLVNGKERNDQDSSQERQANKGSKEPAKQAPTVNKKVFNEQAYSERPRPSKVANPKNNPQKQEIKPEEFIPFENDEEFETN